MVEFNQDSSNTCKPALVDPQQIEQLEHWGADKAQARQPVLSKNGDLKFAISPDLDQISALIQPYNEYEQIQQRLLPLWQLGSPVQNVKKQKRNSIVTFNRSSSHQELFTNIKSTLNRPKNQSQTESQILPQFKENQFLLSSRHNQKNWIIQSQPTAEKILDQQTVSSEYVFDQTSVGSLNELVPKNVQVFASRKSIQQGGLQQVQNVNQSHTSLPLIYGAEAREHLINSQTGQTRVGLHGQSQQQIKFRNRKILIKTNKNRPNNTQGSFWNERQSSKNASIPDSSKAEYGIKSLKPRNSEAKPTVFVELFDHQKFRSTQPQKFQSQVSQISYDRAVLDLTESPANRKNYQQGKQLNAVEIKPLLTKVSQHAFQVDRERQFFKIQFTQDIAGAALNASPSSNPMRSIQDQIKRTKTKRPQEKCNILRQTERRYTKQKKGVIIAPSQHLIGSVHLADTPYFAPMRQMYAPLIKIGGASNSLKRSADRTKLQ